MTEIYSEIEINATSKAVWDILINFEDYPRWNPFIKQISGDLQVGSRIEVFIKPPHSRGMKFKPTILEYKPEEKIQWIGKLLVPKIFDGKHSLIIREISDDKILFIQKERFTGILVPILGGLLGNTKQGFEKMNLALKREAEKK